MIAGAPADKCFCSDGDGGPAVKAHFSEPGSLALDAAGNLYVVESFGHIRRITSDGTVDRFGGYGPQPPIRGPLPPDEGIPALDIYIQGRPPLATGPDGSLYLGDSGFPNPARIRRIRPSGIADTVPGSTGKQVSDLAVAADGTIAISQASRVSELKDGALTSVAGGSPTAAADGSVARDAWLLSPRAIAVNSKGEVYIAEQGTCAIRRIGSDGVLRTFAGTGKCADAQAPLRRARTWLRSRRLIGSGFRM